MDSPYTKFPRPDSRASINPRSSFRATFGTDTGTPMRVVVHDDIKPEVGFSPLHTQVHNEDMERHEILGQFSFAPATQTTVVTTTTTTTTSFPPLILKAPKCLHTLDSKLYPLAASPTPQALRKLRFDVGGTKLEYEEAESAQQALRNLQRQQKDLRESGGVLRSFTTGGSGIEEYGLGRSGGTTRYCDKTPRRDDRRGGQALSGPVHSVVSISEAAKLAGTNSSSRKHRHSRSNQTASGQPGTMARNHALTNLQTCQLSTPLTPSLDAPIKSAFGVYGARRSKRLPKLPQRQTRNSPRLEHRRISNLASPQQDDEEEDLSQTTIEPPASSAQEEPNTSQESQGSISTNSFSSDPGRSNSGLAISASFARPRPAALDTAAAQDISLPSPRLSPVTALANLHNRRGYFDDDHVQRPSRQLALSSPPHEELEDDEVSENVLSGSSLWHQERPIKREYQDTPSPSSLNQHEQPSTLMDMSSILDTFESMPQDMQTYLMYQLLRRCPKPILHFVADAVEPALKCDFLGLLPRELSQMVIGHLDVRSLCRASQVSKKWRQVIDTDEQTWKRLLDAQGFVSSPGELHRAIREGWGWQHISRVDDWERDFSEQDNNLNDEGWDLSSKGEMPTSPTPTSDLQVQSTQVKRSKRKAAAKSKLGGRKQQKRRDTNSALMAQFDYEAITKHRIPDGPSAAREAAAIAVPFGKDGLPSLRQLHLYKSIYRRHHIIRSSWMQDEVKPRHIAFQAHDRFVVTCLQFDTDKILTGSDDTNINVYDTKTGQLRARLEGHEGGVWALQYQGNVLVSGSTDRSVRIWDIKRGVCTHVFQGHTSTVRCLVILMPTVIDIAPDGEPIKMPKEPLIITGSRDSSLRVWRLPKEGDAPWTVPTQDDTDCPYFVRALTGHHHSVRAIAAHGDTLVSGSYDCSVRVWKISTGEVVHRLQGHTQKVYSVVLDHERNRCISGSMDNMVKVWSLDSGLCLFNLEGHSSLVGLLDLQRDRLVSAAADSTLRVWDPENGRCQSTLSAHTGAITCFQHDGQKVISGSDRTLKMWDVRTGQFVRDLLTDLSGVWQVKFDERRCVAAVQRSNLTYIEVLDFGASRDGVPASKRGKRIVLDENGLELDQADDRPSQQEHAIDLDGAEDP